MAETSRSHVARRDKHTILSSVPFVPCTQTMHESARPPGVDRLGNAVLRLNPVSTGHKSSNVRRPDACLFHTDKSRVTRAPGPHLPRDSTHDPETRDRHLAG